MSMRPFEFEGQKYFLIQNELILNDVKIDFPLLLYMPINNNVVLLFREGSLPNKQRLSKYRSNGVTDFICPEAFYPNWLRYLERLETKSKSAATVAELSDVAKKIASGEMNRDEKKKYLMNVGRKMTELLAQIADGDDAAKNAAMEECTRVSRELVQLAMQSHKSKSTYDSLLMLQEATIGHSTAVSTIATIFSLCCGFADDNDLADIAIGSLFHDIGYSQIDLELFETPFDKFNAEEMERYASHVEAGLALMNELGEGFPPLVSQIIEMHHERFDGRGYPNGVSGFEIDERVQIVCLADRLEDMMSGAMTGENLSPMTAFETIKSRDMKDSNNQIVSPDLFQTIYQTFLKSKPEGLERAS